jgi:hypothetical protein
MGKSFAKNYVVLMLKFCATIFLENKGDANAKQVS